LDQHDVQQQEKAASKQGKPTRQLLGSQEFLERTQTALPAAKR